MFYFVSFFKITPTLNNFQLLLLSLKFSHFLTFSIKIINKSKENILNIPYKINSKLKIRKINNKLKLKLMDFFKEIN